LQILGPAPRWRAARPRVTAAVSAMLTQVRDFLTFCGHYGLEAAATLPTSIAEARTGACRKAGAASNTGA